MVLGSVLLKPDGCFDGLDESSATDLGCLQATCTPCGIKCLQQLPRNEVIQPQLPLRLPCYDFTPVTDPTFDGSLPCGLGHRLRVLPASMV